MSVTEFSGELNTSYWQLYKEDCAANGVTPRLSDYSQWLQELNEDMADNYEG